VALSRQQQQATSDKITKTVMMTATMIAKNVPIQVSQPEPALFGFSVGSAEKNKNIRNIK
jgi:hypothetical protein